MRMSVEWTNLANDGSLQAVKDEHAKWLPHTNVPDSERVTWPEDGDDYVGRIEAML